MNEGRAKLPTDPNLKTTHMKRATLLLILFSAMPSYLALFSGTGLAVGIMFISSVVGIVLTCSLADEIGVKQYVTDMVRLGWIVHLIGTMVVYAVHQCF
jgi:hypothetical protein